MRRPVSRARRQHRQQHEPAHAPRVRARLGLGPSPLPPKRLGGRPRQARRPAPPARGSGCSGTASARTPSRSGRRPPRRGSRSRPSASRCRATGPTLREPGSRELLEDGAGPLRRQGAAPRSGDDLPRARREALGGHRARRGLGQSVVDQPGPRASSRPRRTTSTRRGCASSTSAASSTAASDSGSGSRARATGPAGLSSRTTSRALRRRPRSSSTPRAFASSTS